MVFNRILTRLSGFLLLTVFGLVVFHAPLSVYFGQFLPDIFIKSWKELLLAFSVPLVFVLVMRKGQLKTLSKDVLLILITFYALLHGVMLFVFQGALSQKMAGIAIDLRFLLFFILIFALVSVVPRFRKSFIKVGVISAFLSVVFGFLQVVLLPHDILKYLGYSKATIAPYLTVDQNPDYIRINGTLRGPNPLGVYVLTVLLTGLSFVLHIKKRSVRIKTATLLAGVVGLIVIWFTYSRSAILGLMIGLFVIMAIYWVKAIKWQHIITLAVSLLVIGGTLFAMKDSHFVQNTLFHNNPTGGSERNSDDNHASSLEDGVSRLMRQPFGAGIGSTGSASLYGEKPLVIENQYLFVAHETGWLGLGVFVAIIFVALKRLYRNRRDWLALGLFASGIAWVSIGFIQPVLIDDTVSLVWWGAAAVALASAGRGYYGEKSN